MTAPARLPAARPSGKERRDSGMLALPVWSPAALARKFLYAVVVLIMLAVAGLFAYRLYGPQIMRMAFVPTGAFEELPRLPGNAYGDRKMWIARPDLPGNPALWTPTGYKPAATPKAAVFFIHPTSYVARARWNATLDDPEANARAALFLRGQASAFNAVGAVWAPRYRQAAFGAFLTDKPEAAKAIDLAYRDVLLSFDQFLAQAGDRPIILAGHSQGALHLIRLLRERVAGTPLAKRIVAAYVVGWPISRSTDLPALGLPECTAAAQAGCILSWQSYAEPADPGAMLEKYDASTGFNGTPRKGSAMVCTNPLTGTAGGAAPPSANLGTLIPSKDMASASISAGQVGARCDARGVLLIGEPLALGPYVLPGNNFHVFDYSLFWANVRADATRRLAAFKAAR